MKPHLWWTKLKSSFFDSDASAIPSVQMPNGKLTTDLRKKKEDYFIEHLKPTSQLHMFLFFILVMLSLLRNLHFCLRTLRYFLTALIVEAVKVLCFF